jgi:(2Fe-2S) ferredoxin
MAMAAEHKRQILVCVNVDCRARGSEPVLEAFRERVARAGQSDVEVKPYICFGGCDHGPNVVLYPTKAFYSGVSVQDVDDILAHLNGGPVVERLTGKVDAEIEALMFELLDSGLA